MKTQPFRLIVCFVIFLIAVPNLIAVSDSTSLLQSFLQVKELQLAAGYSLATKSDFTKENESLFSTSGQYASPFGALTFWLGRTDLQIGASAQYTRIYSQEIPAGFAVSGLTLTAWSGSLHARYFLFRGLYAALGGGIASTTIRYDGSIGKTSGIHPVLSMRVGYDFQVMGPISIGAYFEAGYRIQSVTADFGSGSGKYSANIFLFQPALLVAYRF